MKILLAPSEGKRSGGEGCFDPCALLFDALCPLREELLDLYEGILERGDPKELQDLFGLKKPDQIARYARLHPRKAPVMKAVLRYDGVAFDALDYPSLPPEAQSFVDGNLVIFSNLFGPLRAADRIPDYRVKQGAAIAGIAPEKRYREAASALLDAWLAEEEILDLRAGFYDRFYKPSRAFTTMKFLKNGKVVSHWAKMWRGRMVREIALAKATNLDEVLALPLEGMHLLEIQEKGKKREVIYEVE